MVVLVVIVVVVVGFFGALGVLRGGYGGGRRLRDGRYGSHHWQWFPAS